MSKYSERLRSAFYAQAVADAMGETFEFRNPKVKEVRKFINGKEPIHITDDTQMALFGQEAVNFAALREDRVLREDIQAAYLRWYGTQTKSITAGSMIGLAARVDMQDVRAPGATCMSSLSALNRNLAAVTNMGAGCGSVMRLLPFAALYLNGASEKRVREICRKSCKVTHSHPTALSAVEWYVDAAIYLMNTSDTYGLAVAAGSKITQYGLGWLASECVDMAIWAVSRALNYDHLLELTIAHPGDSDSVAAVAGSLWGLAGLGGYERHLPRLVARAAVDSVLWIQYWKGL